MFCFVFVFVWFFFFCLLILLNFHYTKKIAWDPDAEPFLTQLHPQPLRPLHAVTWPGFKLWFFWYCLSYIGPWHLGLLCLVWKMCSWNQPQIYFFPYGLELCTNPFWSCGIWIVGIRLLENIICTSSDRRYHINHINMCRNPMPCIKSIPCGTAGTFDFVPIIKQLLKVIIHAGWTPPFLFSISLH